jgi:ABC-2 type transport system permease protein
MKNLFFKEFKLAIHPAFFIFLLSGVLLLIPSWPYFIAFGYIFIAFMNTFQLGRSNQDILFTVSLPVRKRDTVRARFYAIAAIELLQIVTAIPFAIISSTIYIHGNPVMNPNVAFFGFVFVMYAIFNAILLPMFYKTAYKVGLPVSLAVLAALVYMGAVVFAVHAIPFCKINLDVLGANNLTSQLSVLIAGVVISALIMVLAYKKAARNFEKIDLQVR